MREPIPVLMYHSVAPEIPSWAFKYLSLAPAMFEDHLAALARAGFNPIDLTDLHAYMSGQRSLPPRSVVLTFDDGYLDNWVFAFPLLKKYGFKATIFVTTDFIDPRDVTRPTSEDVRDGRADRKDLSWAGFLSVPEMKQMLASGLIDIQCHGKTHTWYFTGNTVLDFHRPGDGLPWLAWNARPERKYLYLEEDQTSMVPFGSPVYVHEKSLAARRWLPDPAIEAEIAGYVASRGGRAFFGKPGWKEDLMTIASSSAASHPAGRFETDEEHGARLGEEIVGSKLALEAALDKKIEFFCWPGGGYDPGAVAAVKSAGYLAWTLGSKAVRRQKNLPGEDPAWMRRIAASPWWFFRGRPRSQVDGRFMELILDEYIGFAFSGLKLRGYKLRRLIESFFK